MSWGWRAQTQQCILTQKTIRIYSQISESGRLILPGKPRTMPVQQPDGRILLIHKGATAELLLYGATVISWKAGSGIRPEPIERLFVSSKALLNGSKPVRGGIPVVFPCFGPPTHPQHSHLVQHGFARSEMWKFDRIVMDNEDGVSVRLTLEPTEAIASKYKQSFHLAYVVTLEEHQLSTDLHVTNTSTSTEYPLDNLIFQALFHNYILAPADQVLVSPLQGKTYYDKTEDTEEGRKHAKVESRLGVDVLKRTDSVYENAPQSYEVTWWDEGLGIQTKNLKNVVIWNPQSQGSKIGDMEDNGWERFVCVEPGYVSGFVELEPGKTWIGQQILSV